MKGKSPIRKLDIDRHVVDDLARRYRSTLLRYFQRRGVAPLDAEDAVQEVFVRLSQRKALADDVHQPESYIFATAANVATDLHRRATVRANGRHELFDDVLHAPLDLDPETICAGREALRAVVVALKELPERTRTIFILARLEQMKQAEIARRLGVSLNTVEKHLHRAVAYLGERAGRRS
ncbi:MAG: sigma-70 family RNA polymerase sigma factor [Sphingomonas sp.]|uniref:RNA polymerase sigma factor n=1 Tax=unclassified Sphingomonas TaxID=196159 RepID=UPI002456E297|nr:MULTISPECIES: sigma-70 family RNA polymerase sigma factor [unclassified Sphingomonas]MBQ1497693.1 sigma-70 family RNA polymerase sigma factor [Sphingomonas sp.]MDH4746619.1 sigma-70 family RNA polymerase sigma factor [Sphingomonas sp. CBMAI 2297]